MNNNMIINNKIIINNVNVIRGTREHLWKMKFLPKFLARIEVVLRSRNLYTLEKIIC